MSAGTERGSGGAQVVRQAHRLDCEAVATDCRFVVPSENEAEAIELARVHMRNLHGRDGELRSRRLTIV